MKHSAKRRLLASVAALFFAPLLMGANEDGCGGDVPIGGDNPPPGGVACGKSTCGDGEFCCNDSCGICAPEGGACILLECQPDEVPCGNSTCGAGEFCCDPACGICGSDGACPAIACEDPEGEPCGENFCGSGEYCCNPSCGICAGDGEACITLACEPRGEPCGNTTCGDGEYCCNESCSICAPDGGACTLQYCEPQKDCVITGCSGQLCAEEELGSTCEWLDEYACYQSVGVCERDAQGTCGWKQTPELVECLEAN